MDKFVARLNIEHYRKKLAIESDEAQRKLFPRTPTAKFVTA
jgi:hypothetical protein